MLPSFGGLPLGPPTGNLALVARDDEACVISGEEFRNGDLAWQLESYRNKDLPPGTGEGQRDAPENIELEPAYYDIMSIAKQLAMRPYSPATRNYVTPKDRLMCVKLANTLIPPFAPKFEIRDYENFYDEAEEVDDWSGYQEANDYELVHGSVYHGPRVDDDDAEYIAGMSPVSPGRSPPRLPRRQPHLSRTDPAAVNEFYAERNRGNTDEDPMDTVEDTPDPPNRNEWSFPLSVEAPDGRDGITRDNYVQVGKDIFIAMLRDLTRDYGDNRTLLQTLEDSPAEDLFRVWLGTFVVTPSELCAVWFYTSMLTTEARLALLGLSLNISHRAINFATFTVEAMAQFVFEDLNTRVTPPAMWPSQWYGVVSAPNWEDWEADAKERMKDFWNRIAGDANADQAFRLLEKAVVEPDRTNVADEFAAKGFRLYRKVVLTSIAHTNLPMKTIIADAAANTRELFALDWAVNRAAAEGGYGEPEPRLNTYADGALKVMVDEYVKEAGIGLPYPYRHELPYPNRHAGPNTTWITTQAINPMEWAVLTETMRWKRTVDDLEARYKRVRDAVLPVPVSELLQLPRP